MIQRPQTIFLALVLIAEAFTSSGQLIWSKIGKSGQAIEMFSNKYLLYQDGKIVQTSNHIMLTLLILLSTIITLAIIFSFKNRMRQMLLGLINSLVIAATMGYAFWIIFKQATTTFDPDYQGAYGMGFYALVVALLGNMIANRLIRKDEMLVQSSNRMR